MISKASAKYVRISPRKVRYVIDLIRAKSVREAQGILNGSPRRAGEIVKKLLNQAIDAAEKNSKVRAENLFISKVMADGGPSMKRFRAASMGRASVIKKRTSHIQLELDLVKGAALPAAPKRASKPAAANVPPKMEAGGKAAKKTAQKKLVGAK
ncbi:MAG: 50S ribosomal protein L22 [Candidatus Omnitrophota bacterium]